MVSIKEVARLAGVSPITASRVVRNQAHVTPETRERVLRAISELNYIPNGVARGLRESRSGMIAIIATAMSAPVNAEFARGAQEAAHEAGVKLVVSSSDDDPVIEADLLQFMGEHRVDGLVITPNDYTVDILRALPAGTPVVVMEGSLRTGMADVVRCDNRAGAEKLTKHLLDLGHRRISIVGGLANSWPWTERVNGYLSAHREAGVPVDEDLIITGTWARQDGERAVGMLFALNEPPDAIIAGNTRPALGILDALLEIGMSVPDTVSVASIDDPLPISNFWQRLTVAERPVFQMGRAAIELLLARLANPDGWEPQEIVFQPNFRVGMSCGELNDPPGRKVASLP